MTFLQVEPAYDKLDTVKELFVEYQAAIGLDLSFQKFGDELASLPGKYSLPHGRLYIASVDDSSAGCIALRAINKKHCEMKRLYVRTPFRGLGIGRALAEKVIADAETMGYNRMLLDTLPSMPEAISLYRKLGFVEIEAYCHNPYAGVVYLGLALRD